MHPQRPRRLTAVDDVLADEANFREHDVWSVPWGKSPPQHVSTGSDSPSAAPSSQQDRKALGVQNGGRFGEDTPKAPAAPRAFKISAFPYGLLTVIDVPLLSPSGSWLPVEAYVSDP
jgi:hypothetical protein